MNALQHSLSPEGIEGNKAITKSVRLENGLNFRVFLRFDV